MAWHVIADKVTGRLMSQGMEPPEAVRPDAELIVLAERPEDDHMWDEASRSFVPRPQKVLVDQLDDLEQHPAYQELRDLVIARLSPRQRRALRRAIQRLLGGARYRNPSDPPEVMPPL